MLKNYKHIQDKLDKAYKLQKEWRNKTETAEKPRSYHLNPIQELDRLAKINESRDAATMIHRMQQEMMETFLPHTKFTKEVMFYDDYLFTMTEEEIDVIDWETNNEFIEQVQINRIEIATFLDYQGNRAEKEYSRRP